MRNMIYMNLLYSSSEGLCNLTVERKTIRRENNARGNVHLTPLPPLGNAISGVSSKQDNRTDVDIIDIWEKSLQATGSASFVGQICRTNLVHSVRFSVRTGVAKYQITFIKRE